MKPSLLFFALCVALSSPLESWAAKRKAAPRKAARPAAAQPAPDTPVVVEEAPADETEDESSTPAPAPEAAPAAAKEPPPPPPAPGRAAYTALESALGAEALKLLVSKDFLLVYTPEPKIPHLVYGQWAALQPLVKNASALADAAAAIDGVRLKRDPASAEEALRTLHALPPGRLVTPPLHAVAALLLESLAEARKPGKPVEGERPFVALPWAKVFTTRYGADTLEDPEDLAAPFFEEVLAGPGRSSDGTEHFLTHMQQARGVDAVAVVERDAKAGTMSSVLKGHVATYLQDQRRVVRSLQAAAELSALYGRSAQNEAADLALVAGALAKAPRAIEEAQAALRTPAPAAASGLSGGDLHLHSPRQGILELGDRAEFSAAYWVDGLPKGESVPVFEAAFADRGAAGIHELTTRTGSRASGGPHALSGSVALNDSKPFVYRLILAAGGAPPVFRELTVTPGTGVDVSLQELARADASFAACRLKEASDAYDVLEKELAGRPGKAQYADLLTAVRGRRKKTETTLAQHASLEGTLEGLRVDASTKECAFKTDRGEAARQLLRKLPAGCSRELGPEVHSLLLAAAQRQRDQETFSLSVTVARRHEQACRSAEAAELFAGALAVLDADPAARCGPLDAEYKSVQSRELPGVEATGMVRAEFGKAIEAGRKAAEGGDPAGVLKHMNPMLARLDALPNPGCFQGERKQAQQLSDQAAVALLPPAQSKPGADDTDGAVAAVTKEKARLEKEAAARRQKELEQAAPPTIEAPEPAAVPPDVETVDAPAQPAADVPPGYTEAEKAPAPKPSMKRGRKNQ